MSLIMNLQNLKQENSTILMIKAMDKMVMEIKMVQLLCLKQKSLNHYSDGYVLVTGDIAVAGGDQNNPIAFKNCAPFTRCITHINDEHVKTAENLDIIMPMYNLLEYSDN